MDANVSAPEAKILLVDDVDINLTVGTEFLKMHNIIPDTAMSAKEAIEKIRQKDYDIVFMDHMMPETDGGEASKIIRGFGGKYAKSEDGGTLKIIALTAIEASEAEELMLESGMDDILPKPITKQKLNEILLKWLPPEKYEAKGVLSQSQNQDNGEQGEKQGDSAVFAEFVKSIMSDIERFDRAAALEKIKNAEGFNFGEKGNGFFKSLEADLEDYDYDAAMEKLLDINAEVADI